MEQKSRFEEVKSLIENKVRESQQLEYKAAKSLDNKDEITIDVSSFANASGGSIIYGISEIKDKNEGAIPDKIDPIPLSVHNHEYLDQVISNIQPRILNYKIEPISTSEGNFIYIVNIPQSFTAHQANDHRYYRRYNFTKLPMKDYEIRDVMNRVKHPKVILKFKINGADLIPILYNEGNVLAKYVRCVYRIPVHYLNDRLLAAEYQIVKGSPSGFDYYLYDSLNKNVIHSGLEENLTRHTLAFNIVKSLQLNSYYKYSFKPTSAEPLIEWTVYADNGEAVKGTTSLHDCLK
jgi:hypothetical protein